MDALIIELVNGLINNNECSLSMLCWNVVKRSSEK